ncbi:MAG: hypothetical protein ACP5NS_05090 [Candidatus Pacearchaeota archaeon]
MNTDGAMLIEGDLTTVHDTAVHQPGTIVRDADMNQYVFGKGVADTAAGYAVSFDESWNTALIAIDGANKGKVGFAMAALVANKYGWYLIEGTGNAFADDSVADNALVYSSDVAGQVDDDSSSEVQLKGCVFRASRSGEGLVAVEIHNGSIGIA